MSLTEATRALRRAAITLLLLPAGSGLADLAAAAPTPPRASTKAPASPAAAHEATTPEESEEVAQQRALAEGEYKKGYKDAEKAKKFLKEENAAEAAKHFGKALKRFEEAVRLYEPYADAWNMIGFCSRQVGDLKRAFDAYDRALAIDPEHEEAHEYVGEAYVKVSNFGKAREHLEWLRAHGSDEAEELAEVIEQAERAKASASGATTEGGPTGAGADSSAAR